MKGVEPSGPRALSNFASSATNFMNFGRSPSCSASTMATALGLTGGNSASLASASGQSAPWSIHVLMVWICSGLSAPVGGICIPYVVPRYPVKQKAVVAAAGNHATAADDRAFPIEAHSTALLRGPVAGHAVLPQDRQHIVCRSRFGQESVPAVLPQKQTNLAPLAQFYIPAYKPPKRKSPLEGETQRAGSQSGSRLCPRRCNTVYAELVCYHRIFRISSAPAVPEATVPG